MISKVTLGVLGFCVVSGGAFIGGCGDKSNSNNTKKITPIPTLAPTASNLTYDPNSTATEAGLANALAILDASSNVAITDAQLQKACTNWQTYFGTDKAITISATNLLDKPATATWVVLAHSQCFINNEEAMLSISRTDPFFNNEALIYTLVLKRGATETWAVSHMFSENCNKLVYGAYIKYLKDSHVSLQPEFDVVVHKKAEQESCPIQIATARNKILEVLNQ